RPRYLLPVMVLALGGALFYAHLQIAQWGEDYKGTWMSLDRLFDLSLALGVAAIAFGVGRRMAGLLSLGFAGAAEELSVSVMMGVGVIGLVVLGLGLVGLLAPLAVGLALAVLVAFSWRETAALYGVVKACVVAATATRGRLVLTIIFCA